MSSKTLSTKEFSTETSNPQRTLKLTDSLVSISSSPNSMEDDMNTKFERNFPEKKKTRIASKDTAKISTDLTTSCSNSDEIKDYEDFNKIEDKVTRAYLNPFNKNYNRNNNFSFGFRKKYKKDRHAFNNWNYNFNRNFRHNYVRKQEVEVLCPINSTNNAENKDIEDNEKMSKMIYIEPEMLLNSTDSLVNSEKKSLEKISEKSEKTSEPSDKHSSKSIKLQSTCSSFTIASKEPQKKCFLPLLFDIEPQNLTPDKLHFYKLVSKELHQHSEKIQKNNKNLFFLRILMLNKVSEVIIKTFNETGLQINFGSCVYGSQASGLATEESDIDLLVNFCSDDLSTYTILEALSKNLEELHFFKRILPLPKATVPVIKLDYELRDDEQHIAEVSGINILKMDISFNEYKSSDGYKPIPSLCIIQYIMDSLNYLPNVKHIILLIKKYLKAKDLNNYYKGGLSSFAIFLLVFSFYKYKINILKHNVNEQFEAHFLLQFLDFYSKFSFTEYLVDINQYNPYVEKSDVNTKFTPVILDPLTEHNISSNTFCINEIQDSFRELKCGLMEEYNQVFLPKKKKYANYNNDKLNNFFSLKNDTNFLDIAFNF